MSESTETYEVYALRYGGRQGQKSSDFFRYYVYGEEDRATSLDYYFWLIRNGNRTVLLDCGFDDERGAARKRHQDTSPLELLARLDVSPGEVDHIVISHMHFDHVGNLDLFPNATVSIAREEFEFWTGPYGRRAVFAGSVEDAEIEMVRQLDRDGRLQLVDGEAELFPGIDARRLAGHTPGQMVVAVSSPNGQLVLASDAVHYYEELEKDRPFCLFSDLEAVYRAYEDLRALDALPDTTVVAGHDPRDMSTYRQVAPDCLDLTDPLR